MMQLSSARLIGTLATTSLLVALTTTIISAQAPQRRGPAIDMQVVADSLGVECEYCHAQGQVTSNGKPRLDVAREMIAMTTELNARVQTASGKTPAEAVRVDCSTCHHGVPVPKPLRDLVLDSAVRQGGEAAAKLYRDLRTKYYGSQSYDFSEQTLLTVADRLAQSRPEAAIAISDLNLEFYPKSSGSYLAMSQVKLRKGDRAAAIKDAEEAVKLDPMNAATKRQLDQLKAPAAATP